MDDVVSGLLEAITAKEERARTAIVEAASRGNPEGVAEWHASECGGLYYKDTNDCFATGTYGGDVPRAARALIVDNDPSSVLRRCAADRRLIAIHEKGGDALGEPVCLCCATATLHGDCEGEWPCETLATRFDAYGLSEHQENE